MPRALRLPKRYADVAGALATRYADVHGWAFHGPDDWRIWPTPERWAHRPAVDRDRATADAGDPYTDAAIRALLGLGKPTRKTRAVAASERDAAMAAVDGHDADTAWRAWVWRWIAELVPGQQFIGDDVWTATEAAGVAPPHDPRALGPLVKRAQVVGIIVPTGQYRQSPRRHLSPVMLWERTTTPALAHAVAEVQS